MSREDFVDVMVKLIPKYPTLDTYKAIINDNEYFKALFNTTTLSLLCGIAQMLTCAVVGYGLSKFKFKGRNILFFAVIFTMVIPHETLQMSMFMKFRYFDIWGIYGFIAKTFGLSTEATPGNRQFAEYLLAVGNPVLHRLGVQERSVYLHHAPVLQGCSR